MRVLEIYVPQSICLLLKTNSFWKIFIQSKSPDRKLKGKGAFLVKLVQESELGKCYIALLFFQDVTQFGQITPGLETLVDSSQGSKY